MDTIARHGIRLVGALTLMAAMISGGAGAAQAQGTQSAAGTGGTVHATAATSDSGRYIYARIHGKDRCIENHGYTKAKGAAIDAWDCVSHHKNEQWTAIGPFTDHGYISFLIRNDYSHQCLNVAGASKKQGAWVVQWPCSRSYENEVWHVASAGDKPQLLKNNHSGLCLNISGSSTANGAHLVQWACSARYANEMFYSS
jgi:hypothetical protein